MEENLDSMATELNHRWQKVLEEERQAEMDLSDANKMKKDISSELNQIQEDVMRQIKCAGEKIQQKIIKINEVYHRNKEVFLQLIKKREYQPPKRDKPSQESLDNLQMQMVNLLKFDCLSKKKQKMGVEYQNQCFEIKDEIKKAKLKISLTELQLNEVQNSTKRNGKY